MKNWLGGLIAVLLLAGCSSEPAASVTVAKAKTVAATTPAAEASAPQKAAHQSRFTVDSSLRDPFFPGSKKASAATTGQTPAPAMNIPTLLQAGFQGVIAAGESRIAIINNVLLEEGRNAVIPLSAGGQRREVAVRVREVLPNSIVLEIQGEGQPITIRRAQR